MTPELAAETGPGAVVRTIVGLVVLMAFAAAGGHPRVRALEERLGVRQVIAAGLPFIALGLVAAPIGVLSGSIVDMLAPVQRIGLGWIGFALGFRFDARMLDGLPVGAASAVALGTALPFAAVGLATGLLLFGTELFGGAPLADPTFIRDALILGSAGAMTADTAVRGMFPPNAADRAAGIERVVQLEELAGVVGLAVLAAFFRPAGDATWQLPGIGWLFVTLGVGTTLGVVVYAIARLPATGAEAVVQLLGSVAFAAGMASYLRLSPVVVCFVAGAVLANLPGGYHGRIRDALMAVERPLYLMFLVIVGALWDWRDATGWLLLLLFVPARLAGKWVGARLAFARGQLALDADQRRALVLAPMGALPVAIVVNAQLLYPHGSVPALVTAVVGGAMVTELLVQLALRARAPT